MFVFLLLYWNALNVYLLLFKCLSYLIIGFCLVLIATFGIVLLYSYLSLIASTIIFILSSSLHTILYNCSLFFWSLNIVILALILLMLMLLMLSSLMLLLYYFSLIPWSLNLNGNYKVGFLAIDNANIVFLLLVQLLFPIITWIGNFESKTITFSLIFDNLIYINLFILFSLSNVLLFFILFEFLIIILFILLLLFLQSYYWIRTSFFFFYYSIFGSLTFILSLLLWIMFTNSLFIILIIIPILIKMPSFPFFYWLPEVHSESNSSISLLLAGLILKLSIYGLIRFILSTFYLSLIFLTTFVLTFTLLGVAIITCSCFRYFDLKKIIAFSSILHLNLVLVSCLSFNSCGLLSGIFISLSHSFSSIALFLLAGLLINKTYSRYIDSIFMLDLVLRVLLALFLLANLNVPGSINFLGELLSLISIVSIDTLYIIFFLITAFLSSLLWFIILNRKLTYNYSYSLSINPLLILIWLFIIIFYFGLYFLSLLVRLVIIRLNPVMIM